MVLESIREYHLQCRLQYDTRPNGSRDGDNILTDSRRLLILMIPVSFEKNNDVRPLSLESLSP
jgi:hypothetical protein